MKLNKVNYHSIASNRKYFSASQFKTFLDCESRAIAEIERESFESKEMFVGTYVHTYFEGQKEFMELCDKRYDDLYKNTKEKYKHIKDADAMIETIEQDKFCMMMLNGEKELILEFEWLGVLWKAKIDNLNLTARINNQPAPFFTDIKTCKKIYDRVSYDPTTKTWLSFVEAWKYDLQMAIYKKGIEIVYGVNATPYIIAVSKEDPPDKEIIEFLDWQLEDAEILISQKIERFKQVKNGEVPPKSCRRCAHCRSNKKLDRPITSLELIED